MKPVVLRDWLLVGSNHGVNRARILDMRRAGASFEIIRRAIGHKTTGFISRVITEARENGDPRADPLPGTLRRFNATPIDLVERARAARADRVPLRNIAATLGISKTWAHRLTYGFHPDHSPSRSQVLQDSSRENSDRQEHLVSPHSRSTVEHEEKTRCRLTKPRKRPIEPREYAS